MTSADRIRRLEDAEAIRELIARYCFRIDDRDLEGVAALFTADGCFRSADGVMNARGREAVVEQFVGRYAALGPTFHFTHDRTLSFDDSDPDRASGRVASHAEVVRNREPMIVALRYDDRYQREDGAWRFSERALSFFYYMPVEQYASAMRGALRMRAYGEARPADYPESLATYQRHHLD